MTDWILEYDHFDSGKQPLRETLCTLGNGYFATRGAFCEEKGGDVHYPGTYLAGGYNRLKTEVAGKLLENEDLVNMPNWLALTFKVEDGEWFSLKAVEILSFGQKLHLKKGVLSRKIRFKDASGRITTIEEKRLVHIRYFHLAAMQLTLTPENWSGTLHFLSAIDGRVINSGVKRYKKLNSKHLVPLESGVSEDEHPYLKVETSQSKLQVALAARNKVFQNKELILSQPEPLIDKGYVGQHYCIEVKRQDVIRFEKIISLYTSRDHAISEPLLEALSAVKGAPSFASLVHSQAQAWKGIWNEFDIEITAEKKTSALLVLRLHTFHLLQTVNYNTLDFDVGVPARGWHGEAYRGHIFWDELFIYPLLNLRIPKITLSLLKYRYRRLGQARASAQQAGYKGAMFPWQSGSNGREESQTLHLNPQSGRWIPDHSSLQRHVNIAIAHNIWRYFEISEDLDFFRSFAAEMFLEICRFLSSLCTYNRKKDRYEILKVMGPDEYHDAYPDSDAPGLDNNAYTNLMTVWLFQNAVAMLSMLPEDHHKELIELIDLTEEEVEQWEKISRKMYIPFHDKEIVSQFEGYEDLKEFPWEEYRQKYGDIQRLDRILEAEGDSPNRYKVSKQADVLMLFYLLSSDEIAKLFSRLGYDFDTSQIPKNIDYYLARTSHGSTLSRIVHSWVLSRENRAASWELFMMALESDVADIQGGTTAEGIHLGSMAGTVDIIQRCYLGIEPKGDVLWFNPSLPQELKRIRYHLHYRGHSLQIEVDHRELKITSRYSIAKTMSVGHQNKTYQLRAGEDLHLENPIF